MPLMMAFIIFVPWNMVPETERPLIYCNNLNYDTRPLK